jgi:hypothetical protein
MSGPFIQWNPLCNSQENDVAYAADPQRSGGASDPSIFDALLANKLFYQVSIMVTALAQMLTNKGYFPSDGSTNPPAALAALVSTLTNILTAADINNIFTNPIFTGSVNLNGTALSITGNAPAVYLQGTEGGNLEAQIQEVAGFLRFGGGPSLTERMALNLATGVLSADGVNALSGITPPAGDFSQKIATTNFVPAIYNKGGSRLTSPHTVVGFDNLSGGGTASITFSGASAFVNPPFVVCVNASSSSIPMVMNATTATGFVCSGPASSSFYWIAIGN